MNDVYIEQKDFFDFIYNEVDNDRLSHSYLIETFGYKNVDVLIKEFVKIVLCDKKIRNCSCSICTLVDNLEYPDVQYIYADGNYIKKEQLLNLKKNFRGKSNYDNKQIYVIMDASRLNGSSANTILKFLEEPEENIIAILIAENRYKVIETIVSRCQVIPLKVVNDQLVDENISSLLDIIFDKNNITRVDDILKIIPDRVIAREKFKMIEEFLLNNMKNNDFSLLNIEQTVKVIQIFENIIDQLEYNVNYKLCLDCLLVSVLEVI